MADWHADIFERLRGEHFEDGMVRYCGIARSTPQPPALERPSRTAQGRSD